MKIYIPSIRLNRPTVDLLGKSRQIFDGESPNVEIYLTHDIREADAVLAPHDVSDWDSEYERTLVQSAERKLIIFCNFSDFPISSTLPNAISLQRTKNHASSKMNVLIVPYNVKPIEPFVLRCKQFEPSVSFVGYIPRITPFRIWKMMKEQPLNPIKSNSIIVRRLGVQHINSFRGRKRVIVRHHYSGAASLLGSNAGKVRDEYVDSVINYDFIFSPRGDANGSRRFYEVLSAGRIPIVPDTEVALPKILHRPNSFYIINVKPTSSDLSQKIETFWNLNSNSDYQSMQIKNHNLFQERLRYSVFIKHILSLSSPQKLFEYC